MRRESLSLQQLFTILFIAFALLFGISAVAAWTGPTASPPNNNVAAPINVSSTDQVKNGGLGVNALAVFGDELIQTDGHLNFGDTSGDNGYGIRDDNGTMEYKDSGGQWTPFSSGGSNGSNGSNGTSQSQVFTYDTPGTFTWTKPANASTAAIQCWGGGGGGGSGDDEETAGGGGGGYVSKTMALSSLSDSVTVIVAAGGNGAPYQFPTGGGSTGGTSSFGSYAIAYGGTGGAGNAQGFGSSPASGGSYSGGTGENGGESGASTACAGAGGGYDDGSGPAGNSGCGGSGGSGGSGSGDGVDGSAPGGGGGAGGWPGSRSGGSGGAGASGECIITVS